MENSTCKSCKHFAMHYVCHSRSFMPIDSGHCKFPRLKDRAANTKACEHYKCNERKPQL